jgi:small subunit ribosomal protein S6
MTLPSPTYDLVMMLDSSAEESVQERIVGEARAAIESGGELVGDHPWGDRLLTYPIDHATAAKYHLLQFRSGGTELLEQLDRTLRFADEVVRFRIVKLKPGTPPPPDMQTAGVAAPVPEAAPAAPAAPAAETAPEVQAAPEAQAAAEAVPEVAVEATPEAQATAVAPAAESPPEAEATAEAGVPEAAAAPEAGSETAPEAGATPESALTDEAG